MGQIQRALPDFADHDRGCRELVAGRMVGAIVFEVGRRSLFPDAVQPRDEVIDHPVGLGMTGIEPNQLPVGHQVQARQLLRLENDHHGIAQHEARRVADHPREHRITADDGRLDSRKHCVSVAES